MRRRTINFLLFILLLGVGAFFVDFGFGQKPSIDIGGYKNSLDVRQGLDLQGGIQLILTPKCPSDTPHCDINSAMSAVIANVQQRIAGGLAVNDATVREQSSGGTPLILVQLPGLKDDQQALSLLGTTGQMNIIDTGSTQIPVGQAVTVCPSNVTTCPSGSYHVVFRGQQLDTSSIAAGLDSQTNLPIVTFEFNSGARSAFATYTRNHIQQYLTITLDDKVIESATIQSEIDGSGQITGIPDITSAQSLASYLRYGALPLPLSVTSESQLAPTLGQQALNYSKVAAAIGLGMVILFMLIYYRLPGLLADVALVFYAGFLFASIKILGVTLSLPGIAAMVLTIGMAVDANVLIFERVKEELRAGRTMTTAIDVGFKRAWPSIRDSNASTMITCAILYWFGNNFGATIIVGFAVNLFIGVAISLFTAVVVTRNFLNIMVFFNIATHPWLYGLSRSALPVRRYVRPTSRIAERPGRAAIVKAALASEDDEDAVDDEAAVEDEDETFERVGNVTNGRVPASSASNASGARGTEE